MRGSCDLLPASHHTHTPYSPISPLLSPNLATSISSHRATPSNVSAHHRTDEDLINRSLLDSLDAEADAEPVLSSDSEAAGAHTYGSSSSMSSPDSPELMYRFPMQAQPQHRPDSPTARNHPFTHNDQYVTNPHQSMYHNSHPSEFSAPVDRDHISNNVDNFTYRNPLVNNFLQTRLRQSTSATYGNGLSNSYQQSYDITAADVFGTHQSVAPQQQQQQQGNDGIQGSRIFEFSNGSNHTAGVGTAMKNGTSKPIFNIDPFSAVSGSALLQSHQVMKASINQAQTSQGFHNLSTNQGQPYMNGMMHTQSQTPYGPHVPSNTTTPSTTIGLGNSGGSGASQEEISTIFVVGFPEDMQEREFQNMFTFSPGFEAATLKIPNKDLTAYGPGTAVAGGSIGGSSGTRTAPGYQLNYSQSGYGGSNDPYNLVTVNQGGVLVDGRDGTTTAWPSAGPGADDALYGRNGSDLAMGLGGGAHLSGAPTVPPRKQIIGFAKFRSRNEALAARDVLQGRRVDIEKGAVLKAEMAKKNLHTKRGVGPLGGLPISSIMNGTSGSVVSSETIAGMTGLNGLSSLMAPGGETLSARERELGAIGAMGLGGVSQRRDRMDLSEDERDRERENRRRRELGSISSMGGIPMMNASRGPRERAEEDERERERRRKEKEAERNARLRSTNSTAFDAFHSVQPTGMTARAAVSQSAMFSMGNAMLSPTVEVLGSYFPNNTVSQSQSQDSFGLNGVGADGWPIGAVNRRLGSVGVNGALRTTPLVSTSLSHQPSSSQESSPPNTTVESTHSSLAPNSGSSRSGLSDSGFSQSGSAPFSPPTNSISLPPHPSLPTRPRPASPGNEGQYNEADNRTASQQPPSSSSSISGSQGGNSNSSSIDGEMAQTLGGMNIGTHQGMISPQLPSPASGGSSGAKGNASDQNPPINTLYVGNLPTSPIPSGFPPNYLEESLRSLFSRCAGFRKLCYRQKSNGPMCFVEFEDVSYATKALNELYGHQLQGLVKGGIRLSYSKNPLGVRTPTNAVNPNGLQQQQQAAQQAFGSNAQYPGPQDAFAPRQSNSSILTVDVGSLRGLQRDPADIISPTSSSYHYATSPPRFFSPPPSSAFALTPQPGSTTYSRSNSQGYGLSATSSTFSPFGFSSPFHTPSQQASNDISEHASNALSPSPSIEAARAG